MNYLKTPVRGPIPLVDKLKNIKQPMWLQNTIARIIIGIIIVVGIFDIWSVLYLFTHHDSSKLLKFGHLSFFFWFLFLGSISVAAYRIKKYPKKYSIKEIIATVIFSYVFAIGPFSVMTFMSTGLYDTEIWNGYVTTAVYEQEWTEEVVTTSTSCDSKNVCTTTTNISYDHHPDIWKIFTSNGEYLTITRESYSKYVSLFTNETKYNSTHSSQSSHGDGNVWKTVWNGKNEAIVPTAVEHSYVNYLKASKHSILKIKGVASSYKELLLDYPSVTDGQFGNIELNRVLTSGVNLTSEYHDSLNKKVGQILSELGTKKQVNIIVYFVNTGDREFLHAMEEHWTFGKKNDVVIIIGTKGVENKPDWAGIMTFQGNEGLKVKLRDDIEQMSSLLDTVQLSNIIGHHVKDEYNRVPMAQLEYLLYDLEVPIYLYFLALITYVITMFTLITIFEEN